MKRVCSFVLLAAALLSLTPATASAAPGQKGWGGILILSGAGLAAGAFNYKGSQCPPGYSTHKFEGLTTECVYIGPNGDSDVRDATTGVSYERPALLWAGVGLAATGTILLLMPKRAAKAARIVDVAITPKGWLVSKTFHFSTRP